MVIDCQILTILCADFLYISCSLVRRHTTSIDVKDTFFSCTSNTVNSQSIFNIPQLVKRANRRFQMSANVITVRPWFTVVYIGNLVREELLDFVILFLLTVQEIDILNITIDIIGIAVINCKHCLRGELNNTCDLVTCVVKADFPEKLGIDKPLLIIVPDVFLTDNTFDNIIKFHLQCTEFCISECGLERLCKVELCYVTVRVWTNGFIAHNIKTLLNQRVQCHGTIPANLLPFVGEKGFKYDIIGIIRSRRVIISVIISID